MAKKDVDEILEGNEHWPEFRLVRFVRALELEEDLKGGDIDAKAGDYLVVGVDGDVWSVDREDFHNRYKPLTPNKS